MTLVAVLILFPTPSLYARGPDEAIPGGHGGSRAGATFLRDPRAGTSASNPSPIGECDDEEWDDDDGATPLLNAPTFPRPCGRGSRPSRRCGFPMIHSPSPRPRHLRC
jgi:hypothetical protein